MNNNKYLIEYKQNIFTKIRNFLLGLFTIKSKTNYTESTTEKFKENNIPLVNSKKRFNEFILYKENLEELKLINSIREHPEKLYQMNSDDLDNVHNAIKNRQYFIDRKIEKLKTDIKLKKINNSV